MNNKRKNNTYKHSMTTEDSWRRTCTERLWLAVSISDA
jgi:hypothetical protein